MATKNLIPIIAVGAGMYLLMRSGGGSLEKGVANAGKTAEGIARKIKHTVLHGGLLTEGMDFKPDKAGDTLKIEDVPKGSYRAVANFDGSDRSNLVEVYHDEPNSTLYVTSLVPADEHPSISSGFDARTAIVDYDAEGGPVELTRVG